MKYLNTYKLFESEESDEDEIKDNVFDILRDLSDDYDLEISYFEPAECYINSLKREVTAIRVSLYVGPGGLTFRCVKPSVDHLISYMKSIGYNNFIYRDDELNFNQHRPIDKSGSQIPNYLPTDDNIIEYGIFTFIED